MLEDRNLLSIFTVDHLADDALGSGLNGSLRYCINHTTDGDSIQFGVTGTINLTGNLPDLSHSVGIQGPGANLLTVSGAGHANGIFTVGGGATVAIAGLKISGGYGDAGVSNSGISGTLTLTNVSVTGNYPGIFNGGTLTINDSTVTGNTRGIWNGGTLTVNNSTVSGNSWIASFGSANGAGIYNTKGGIFNLKGTVALINSTVSDNFVQSWEGNPDYDTVEGGGICNIGGTVALANCTVSGNTAVGHFEPYSYGVLARGGGIYNGKNDDGDIGTLTVSNSTISGNSAMCDDINGPAFGGGIYNDEGIIGVADSTVSGNYISSYGGSSGGGVYNSYDGLLHPRNTIVAGNYAYPGGPDVAGNLGSQGHNLIGNTYGGGGFDPTDLLNVNPLLGPLQDNGGPTKTMALLAGSPALTAGDPTQLGVADQRGVVRSGGVNIGAYQASASALVLTDLPTSTIAGTALTATLTAKDIFGQTAVGYTGTVHFSSTDGQAVLPGNYAFTLGDGGVHVFSNGVTLKTAGNQTVTATDTVTSSITGSATVTVTPAAADHLLFLQQPTDTAVGQTISPAVMVEIVDPFGNVVTADNTDTVTLTIGTNPGGGTLGGTLTVTVSNGIATFSNLSIDLGGDGYTLHATTTGLTDAVSDPFNIT
jgi:hypothetical protein